MIESNKSWEDMAHKEILHSSAMLADPHMKMWVVGSARMGPSISLISMERSLP